MLTRKQKSKIYSNFLYLITGVITVFSGFLVVVGISKPLNLSNLFYTTTANDSYFLPTILEESRSTSVLGASTEDDSYLYGCNEERPVIGWIDYSGNKVVRETLPLGETASACFKDLEEAKANNFKK